MRTFPLLSLVAFIALAPAAAQADSDVVARAKERFAAGAQAYREARYKDAIDLFLQANKIEPHPELVFNVGQAYEKLADVPNALRSYREYLRLSPGAHDRATVEASIRNLEARLREKGVQQVSVFSSPAGASVLLDQRRVGDTPWTGEIAPGRHVVMLRATGFPDTAKEFLLTGSGRWISTSRSRPERASEPPRSRRLRRRRPSPPLRRSARRRSRRQRGASGR